jgi:hypothetical protein
MRIEEIAHILQTTLLTMRKEEIAHILQTTLLTMRIS